MRLANFFLLFFITNFASSTLSDEKELTCEFTNTEWEPLDGVKLITCDILKQTIDSPGYEINLDSQEYEKIEGLRFTDNQNMNYFPEGIGEVMPNLQGIIGVKTYLTVINANDLKGLKKLKYLNLAKSDLKVIEEGVFDDLISLTELDLSDAGIRFIHENVFQGLAALKTLYLGANKLKLLEPTVFSGLPSLESISLEFNHLEEIDENLFASNTLLADIWLNSNKITIMDWKVFENLKSLSYVDVQENPCIDGVYDSSNFDDLKTNLMGNCVPTISEKLEHYDEIIQLATIKIVTIREELDIDGNIDDGSFSQYMKIIRATDEGEMSVGNFENDPLTKNLECKMSEVYWRLSDKELNTCRVQNQIIDAKDFQFVASGNSIKAMTFDGNKFIKYLPKNIGKFSPNLVEFSAANSSLMLISRNNFAGLRHLRFLNLGNSNIRYIDSDTFDDLTSLEELDLSGNELESIDEELFSKLKNLRVLRIGSNRMHSVHPKLFRSLRNLVNISLSHQYLSNIDESIFKTNGKIQNIWMNSNKLKSISPNMFNNLKSLEYVDLRDNKCIDTVYDQSTFTSMKTEILSKCGSGYEMKMGKKTEVKGKAKNKKKNKKAKKKKEKLAKVENEEEREVVCEYDDIFWPHENRPLRTCIINEAIDDPDYFLSANPILFDDFVDTEKVEAISFVNNKNIKYLPKNIGQVFPNLLEMSAANSGIVEINSRNFKGLKNLKSLNLAGNEISSFSSEIFEDLNSLEELNFDDNQVDTIDTFKHLKSLQKLSMKGNKFEKIEHSWVEGLPELHDATFDVEELLLDWEIFRDNPKLRWISMNGKFYNNKMEIIDDPEMVKENPFGSDFSGIIEESDDEKNFDMKEIECVIEETLENDECILEFEIIDSKYYTIKQSPKNSQVRKFFIVNNQNVKFLPQNLGVSFPILESITIQNTNINTIKKDYFENLPHLETLNLNSNKIKSFESDTFDDLIFLKELNLNGNLIENLEEGIFHKIKKLQKLNLGSNSLHYIHPKTFKFLKRLKDVDLSENQLSVIDESVFKFNPNLEEINLSGNKIETLTSKTFEFSRKLKHIDLSGNNCIDGVFSESTISELKEILVKNCEPTVKTIVKEVYCDLNLDEEMPKDCNIINQPIEDEGYTISIDSDAIDGEKVETLRISNNKLIKHLPGNAGDVFPNLLHFHAANNSLDYLPENVFHALPKLKTLDLTNNKLKEFHPGTFNDLSSLEEINLSGNEFSLIDDSTFDKMPNLRKINLSGNNLAYVTPNAFSKLPRLEEVTVAEGEDDAFEEVEDIIIKIVKRRKKIIIDDYDYDEDVSEIIAVETTQQPDANVDESTEYDFNKINCNIEQHKWSPGDDTQITSCIIVEDVFNGNFRLKPNYRGENIQEIKLENNDDTDFLPNEFRYDFPNLRRVVARNLSLDEIPQDAFENLRDLTEIDLSGNEIKILNENIFQNLPNLATIDLSNNEIEELPIDIFWNLPSLKSIYLNGNKISQLDPEMFRYIPNLTMLSIAGNNLNDNFYDELLKSKPHLKIDMRTQETVAETEAPIINKELSCRTEHTQWSQVDPRGIISCIIEHQPIPERDYKIKSTPTNSYVQELKIENDMDVHFLPDKFNENFPKLMRVIARNLSLEEIPSDPFKNLVNLTEIDLSGNKLKNLDWLQNLPFLEELNLRDNKIEEIPEEIFSNTPSLTKIYLDNNRIRKIHPTAFEYAPKLSKLTLLGNEIVDFDFEDILKPNLEVVHETLSGKKFHDENQFNEKHLDNTTISNNPLIISTIENTSSVSVSETTTQKSKKRKSWRRRTTTTTVRSPLSEISCETTNMFSEYFDDIILTCDMTEQIIEDPEIYISNISNGEQIVALNFENNPNIKYLPDKIADALPNLRELTAQNSGIESLLPGDLENLKLLEIINLSNNKIHFIEPEIFTNLPSLKYLDLSGNEIEFVHEDAFENLPSLKSLKLNNNSITFFDPKTFERMPELEVLNIEGNEISTLSENLLKKNPKLKDFKHSLKTTTTPEPYLITTTTTFSYEKEVECDYGNNYWTYSDAELFTCYLNSPIIDEPNFVIKQTPRNRRVKGLSFLDNKNAEYLPKNIGEVFPNLVELSAYNTSLKEISKDSLKKLKRLKSLNMMISDIEQVDPQAFEDLYSLVNLELSSNKINHLHPETFKNNQNIKALHLGNNNLSEIDPKLLENLPELRNISLESNNISSINRKTFSKNYELQNVWLDGNKISSIDPTTFDGKRKLEYVDLRGNDCIDEIFEGRAIDEMKSKIKLNCPFEEKTFMEDSKRENLPIYEKMTTTTLIPFDNRSRRPTKPRIQIITKPTVKEVTCEYSTYKWPNIICTIVNQSIDERSFVIKKSPRDPQVTELIISDNKNVKFLPENIAKNYPNLEKLTVKNNSIIDLFPESLENLSKLKSLDLSDNDLSIIDPDVFGSVPLLEDLNLSGNHLPLLITETFGKTPRLKNLDISRNEISELHPELLKSLEDLESLSFQNNEILDIPEKMFNENLKLKKIDLSGNKLKSIPSEIFDNLKYLNEVNLNGNECINGAYKEELINALKIDLTRKCKPTHHHSEEDRDEIDSVDPYGYGPSWGVVEPTVNEFYNEVDVGNQIKVDEENSIECDIIEEYSEIMRNNIETCKIGRDKNLKSHWKVEDSPRTKRVKRFLVDGNENFHALPQNLGESFPHLLELEISNTPMKEIQLKNLNNLKTLKLPKNKIKYLDSNTFYGAPNLQNLLINDNNLRHIDDNAFKSIPHLIHLDLSENKLPKISKETLQHLPELKTINLSSNELNHVDFDLFKNNPKLYSIDLRGNNIQSIHPSAFDRLLALFNLDLSRNECIDRKFTSSSINHLKSIISEHCQPQKSLKLELKSCQKLLVENSKRARPMEMVVNNAAMKLANRENEFFQLQLQFKLLKSELMEERKLRRNEKEKLNFFENEVKMLKKSCAKIDESHNFLFDLKCDFIESFNDYSCDAKNVMVGAENSTIESVSGNQKRAKRNSDVTSLTILNQNAKFLPNELHKFFPNLQNLKVDNSKLSKLTKSPFKSLPRLTHVTINNNRIKAIDPTTFNDLIQLESIDLSQNHIEKLPRKLFEELPNLKELNLAENLLTALPQEIIPKVNSLEKFFANNNQFDFIDPRILKKLNKAKVIDLRNGKCIDENYVENGRDGIVRLMGEISLNCFNDEQFKNEDFCRGKKLL